MPLGIYLVDGSAEHSGDGFSWPLLPGRDDPVVEGCHGALAGVEGEVHGVVVEEHRHHPSKESPAVKCTGTRI